MYNIAALIWSGGIALIILAITQVVVNNVETTANTTIQFKNIIYLIMAVIILVGFLTYGFMMGGQTGRR
jgi:hypothetical protein